MRKLTSQDIRRLRLRNQWLSQPPGGDPLSVATHMGALQSQELWSGHWSVGIRSIGSTDTTVHESTLKGQILRTWPIRNTIHFIASTNVSWMLDLARSKAFVGIEKRREFLGLEEADATRAIDVLRASLDHGQPVTRSECVAILESAGVMKDSSHAYHLLWFASQHGAICIGPQAGKEQTFVSLERWVPSPLRLEREEALGELAYRYFNSHGPTDPKEFSRWTNFAAADVKIALSRAGDRLRTVETEFGQMLMGAESIDLAASAAVDPPAKDREILLLSGFDEYMLGYGDRSAMMTNEQLKLVVPGNNGVFRPTVIDDGVVVGTWKRVLKKTRVEVAVSPFTSLDKRQRSGVERAAADYGKFLGLDATVSYAE